MFINRIFGNFINGKDKSDENEADNPDSFGTTEKPLVVFKGSSKRRKKLPIVNSGKSGAGRTNLSAPRKIIQVDEPPKSCENDLFPCNFEKKKASDVAVSSVTEKKTSGKTSIPIREEKYRLIPNRKPVIKAKNATLRLEPMTLTADRNINLFSFDYFDTALVSMGSLVTNLTSYISSDINVTLNGVHYTSTTDLVYSEPVELSGASIYQLRPLDVINISDDHTDIGLYCIEVYDHFYRPFCGAEITLDTFWSDGSTGLTLGGNYNNDDSTEQPAGNDTPLSTSCDTNGNSYSLKKDKTLMDILPYLETDRTDYLESMQPSNVSAYLGFNSDRDGDWEVIQTKTEEPTLPPLEEKENDSSSCSESRMSQSPVPADAFIFVKGFFFINSSTPDSNGSPSDAGNHASFIWLDRPTEIRFEDGAVTIGTFFEYENGSVTFTGQEPGTVQIPNTSKFLESIKGEHELSGTVSVSIFSVK